MAWSPESTSAWTGGWEQSGASVERVREIAGEDPHAALATARRDGTIQASMVRASVLDHPVTGRPAVVALLRPNTHKLRNLRRRPWATFHFRIEWRWVTVEGQGALLGRDDPLEGVDPARFAELRRAHFLASGGTSEAWEAWDRKLDGEHGALVFVEIGRVYQTVPGAHGPR